MTQAPANLDTLPQDLQLEILDFLPNRNDRRSLARVAPSLRHSAFLFDGRRLCILPPFSSRGVRGFLDNLPSRRTAWSRMRHLYVSGVGLSSWNVRRYIARLRELEPLPHGIYCASFNGHRSSGACGTVKGARRELERVFLTEILPPQVTDLDLDSNAPFDGLERPAPMLRCHDSLVRLTLRGVSDHLLRWAGTWFPHCPQLETLTLFVRDNITEPRDRLLRDAVAAFPGLVCIVGCELAPSSLQPRPGSLTPHHPPIPLYHRGRRRGLLLTGVPSIFFSCWVQDARYHDLVTLSLFSDDAHVDATALGPLPLTAVPFTLSLLEGLPRLESVCLYGDQFDIGAPQGPDLVQLARALPRVKAFLLQPRCCPRRVTQHDPLGIYTQHGDRAPDPFNIDVTHWEQVALAWPHIEILDFPPLWLQNRPSWPLFQFFGENCRLLRHLRIGMEVPLTDSGPLQACVRDASQQPLFPRLEMYRSPYVRLAPPTAGGRAARADTWRSALSRLAPNLRSVGVAIEWGDRDVLVLPLRDAPLQHPDWRQPAQTVLADSTPPAMPQPLAGIDVPAVSTFLWPRHPLCRSIARVTARRMYGGPHSAFGSTRMTYYIHRLSESPTL